MKKMKYALVAIVASATLWIAPLATVGLVGCGGGCASVNQGQDSLVVNSERLQATALAIMDTFVAVEENNRAYLRTVSPEIENAANKIRREGKTALTELGAVTRAYKSNRSAENKANINTWLKTLAELQRVATDNLVAANAAIASKK